MGVHCPFSPPLPWGGAEGQHIIIFMLLLFLQYMRKKLNYIFETFFRFHLEK